MYDGALNKANSFDSLKDFTALINRESDPLICRPKVKKTIPVKITGMDFKLAIFL
jgi:hypothetical protein